MLQLPITWLGTTMRGVLLPLIASIPRKLYVEPFVGAGGLFFGKPQEAAEVINDRNKALVNMFKMMREPIVAADMQALLLQTAPWRRKRQRRGAHYRRLCTGAERFEVEKQTTVPTDRAAMTARCEVVYYKRANCDIIGATTTTGGNYGVTAQLRLF